MAERRIESVNPERRNLCKESKEDCRNQWVLKASQGDLDDLKDSDDKDDTNLTIFFVTDDELNFLKIIFMLIKGTLAFFYLNSFVIRYYIWLNETHESYLDYLM